VGEWKLPSYDVQESKYVSSKAPFSGVLKDWKAEITCCFLGVAALTTIVATLVPFQGGPLPRMPYDVSLNSLISLCVILLKAAMFVILCQGENAILPGLDILLYSDFNRSQSTEMDLLWQFAAIISSREF
jgi:hypothetical protein